MRKRKNAAVQAAVYLTLVLTLPFIGSALVKSAPFSVGILEAAAENSVSNVLGTPIVTTVSPIRETFAEASTQIVTERTFKIITDDSVIHQDFYAAVPRSYDEEAEIDEAPPLQAGNGTVEIIQYGFMTGDEYVSLPEGQFGQIRNLYGLDEEILLEAAKNTAPKLKGDGSPEVLIYHTHATESYLIEASDTYDTAFLFRSTDECINMVSIGNAIKDELEKSGIGVIHDKTLYDEESYNGSYELSRKGVTAILEENPTIKIVIDVHRDAIVRSETEIVAPTCLIDGKEAAQIMIVSNCNSNKLKYPIPDFLENLTLACDIQNAAEGMFPGLMRPILFDDRQYNQDLSTGCLLIEIGGHGNSLAQAEYSGQLLGKAIAALQE
ncbi:MAG: stage II sporulation protein P [Ruminococcus sp.]|jgi:stage II sporulation protein P|nr:stage II sporulation protein P [Ruminococcus sp.]